MAAKTKKKQTEPKTKIPFELLADRKRKKTFLLRLNDDELNMLLELSAMKNVSRSNVMRMLLKQGHAEIVEKPLRAQAEVDVVREAARLATNDQIEHLRKELLARVRVVEKRTTKKGGKDR